MSHGYKVTELTANKLDRVTRNPTFAKITENDIAYFKSILPIDSILESSTCPRDVYLKYTTDWYNVYRAEPALILLPTTTEQVSLIMRHCNMRHLAIVPQSGNTSACGGSVPVFDEIIVSTHHLACVRSFDGLRGDLVCDAGCVLEDLDRFLLPKGYQMPLDLPARHLCRIGGNIATNAGGIRQMRYGNLYSTVMGLEVVLADGTILDGLTALKKDNSGYHLKNLFLGSEGTLGILTGVAIATARIRHGVQVIMLAFSSFEHVVEVYRLARIELPETLAAFEVFDHDCMQVVKERQFQEPSDAVLPVTEDAALYVVLETAGKDPIYEAQKANKFVQLLQNKGLIIEGAVAISNADRAMFWSWRTKLPRAIVQYGPSSIHFDVSLPLLKLYQLVEDIRQWAMEEGLLPDALQGIYGYGHVGDGNLHLTIPAMRDDDKLTEKVDRFVYTWTARYKGSVSAEHGIGLMKSPYLAYTKSLPMIDTMRKVKDLFDPHGILNPYKMFPNKDQQTEGDLIRKRYMVGC